MAVMNRSTARPIAGERSLDEKRRRVDPFRAAAPFTNESFAATRTLDRIEASAAIPRFRSILVPVDGHSFGEHALPFALALARRAEAKVRLVHVQPPLRSAFAPQALYYNIGLDSYLQRRRRAYLNDLAERVQRASSLDVRAHFLLGRDAVDELTEAAAKDADLVVMATRGRGALGRLWFGSTAAALMERLAVPMVFVRGSDAPADLTSDPMPRRILMPLDGSEQAERILDPALALGSVADAQHTLLRIARWKAGDSTLERPDLRCAAAPNRDEAWDYLCRVADARGMPPMRLDARLLYADRSIADLIVEFAVRNEVDLIAMATGRRTGLARCFGSSVARQVISRSPSPVMVLPIQPERDAGADG